MEMRFLYKLSKSYGEVVNTTPPTPCNGYAKKAGYRQPFCATR